MGSLVVLAGLLAGMALVVFALVDQRPRHPVIPFGCEVLPGSRLVTWVPHAKPVERSEAARNLRCGWTGRTPGQGWVILYVQVERQADVTAARRRRDELQYGGRLVGSTIVCPRVGSGALLRTGESDDEVSTWVSFHDSNVTVRVVYRSGGAGRLSRDATETTAVDIARLVERELRTARPPRWNEFGPGECQSPTL